ncbi:MAG: phenylalanine--tRNA ligase subunit alpha [Candidatus Micrarchaeaceae archaeon]
MYILHEYEMAILDLLKKKERAGIDLLQEKTGIGKDSVVWAVENLGNRGMVRIEKDTITTARITDEGTKYLKKFPEEDVILSIYGKGGRDKPSNITSQVGLIWAKKNGWLKIEGGAAILTEKGAAVASGKSAYDCRNLLDSISGSDNEEMSAILDRNKDMVENLRHRNILEVTEKSVIREVVITDSGASARTGAGEGIGALTREIIASGRWKKDGLREYDIDAGTERIYPARLHPMHEFINIIRDTWLSMGFTEVSGPIIESAFWNFDALFSPQDHPTRDMQDTFFLKNPPKISVDDIALMNRVKKMHVKNWKEHWREDLAQQALLRTHTTSVSARYINRFAKNTDNAYPIKLFSVGKVFRNEAIDYKHLAEMYQIDGIIIGGSLTLSNLISTLKQFYGRLGVKDIMIKPSYFPFVEPGLEVYYYDEAKKDTVELCGGGIIRKEITRAMGTKSTVLAWGCGLDRLMFKELGISSLTELYKNDIGWLRNRPGLDI